MCDGSGDRGSGSGQEHSAYRVDDFAGFSRITAPVLRSALTVINFFGIPELKNTLVLFFALQRNTQKKHYQQRIQN